MIRFLWVRNGPNSYCSVCCLNLHLTISSYIFLENSFARRPFTYANFFLSFHTKNNLLKQKMPTTNFLPCQKSYHSLHSCVRLFLSPAAAIFLSICFLLMLSCQVWFHICNSFFLDFTLCTIYLSIIMATTDFLSCQKSFSCHLCKTNNISSSCFFYYIHLLKQNNVIHQLSL